MTVLDDAFQAMEAAPSDDLDTLVGLSTGTDKPVLIKDAGTLVGVVSKDVLLRGLQGSSEQEAAA